MSSNVMLSQVVCSTILVIFVKDGCKLIKLDEWNIVASWCVYMLQIIYLIILVILVMDGWKNTMLDKWNIVHAHMLEGLKATIIFYLYIFFGNQSNYLVSSKGRCKRMAIFYKKIHPSLFIKGKLNYKQLIILFYLWLHNENQI